MKDILREERAGGAKVLLFQESQYARMDSIKGGENKKDAVRKINIASSCQQGEKNPLKKVFGDRACDPYQRTGPPQRPSAHGTTRD